MGMFVRALAYMMSHGSDGLRQVAEDAVLNANYLRGRLADDLSLSFPGVCMHEVLFDDRFLKATGVTTLDFAKALIDEGYHPMTMYFPLIVHGAMLIEPTETESKASLDRFIEVVTALAAAARSGDTARFHAAPVLTPRRRLDETTAARKPVLRWRPEPVREGGISPSPPVRGEREGPAAQRWEGEVAVSSLRRRGAAHLTPTLSPRKRAERERGVT
jgi:glycine cleavage system P protein (glycine dehydrogenase) subunit 2